MQPDHLNVALFPMRITWGDKEANLSMLEEAMERLHPQTDLLILPEMFSTGFQTGTRDEVRPLAERNTGATIDRLKALAKKHCVAIAGTFIADTGGLLFNRAFVLEPSGDETFADKRHLFTFAAEDATFSAGHRRLKIRYRGWDIAMVVCYDIRFPVWCRNTDPYYDVLICSANWPESRTHAWQTLLPARAIENQAYVCAVNCQGTDSAGYAYDGFSQVYDYKGKPIAVHPEGSEFLYATLAHNRLEAFRSKFRAWQDADSFRFTD